MGAARARERSRRAAERTARAAGAPRERRDGAARARERSRREAERASLVVMTTTEPLVKVYFQFHFTFERRSRLSIVRSE